MYKAIHRATNAEIVILEPTWSEQIESLRNWGQEDVLVCQECQQPVRVRAGQVRTWHFAHKHRQDCPIGHESPQLLQARALLYRWLVGKFGAERVTLEKRIEGAGLPRPVDCWVKGERNFAYWIFEAGLKPERRDALHTALTRPDVIAHWLFLTAMLQQNEDDKDAVHLTTTEREFMRPSDYDNPVFPGARTLHYLDPEGGRVTTYRGLHLRHAPQVYEGKPLGHLIDQVLVMPKTGEFVHPGEHEQLKAYQEEQQKREKIVSRHIPPTRPRRPIIVSPPATVTSSPLPISPNPVRPPQSSSTVPVDSPMGICEICGEETNDWWFYDGKTGKCRCRKCQRQGRTK